MDPVSARRQESMPRPKAWSLTLALAREATPCFAWASLTAAHCLATWAAKVWQHPPLAKWYTTMRVLL